MNKNELFIRVIKNKELKKYWEKIDENSITPNNILISAKNIKHLKLVHLLFEDSIKTKNQIINNLNEIH